MPPIIKTEIFDQASTALDRLEERLACNPVANNLILSLLRERIECKVPVAVWAWRDASTIQGVALQTSRTHLINLSDMSPQAAKELAVDIFDQVPDAPGVAGEARAAAAFAGRWTELANVGAFPKRGLRVFECLPAITLAAHTGELRPATIHDRARLVEMLRGFYSDTGNSGDPEATVDSRLKRGLYRLLVTEGGAQCGIGTTPVIHGVARIQFLWTEPSMRRSGLASFAVSTLSQELLKAGVRPILFTDLGVPNTNRLYRRLGFRAVEEHIHYDFRTPVCDG